MRSVDTGPVIFSYQPTLSAVHLRTVFTIVVWYILLLYTVYTGTLVLRTVYTRGTVTTSLPHGVPKGCPVFLHFPRSSKFYVDLVLIALKDTHVVCYRHQKRSKYSTVYTSLHST